MGGRLLIFGWHNVEGSWCFPSAPGAGTRGIWEQFQLLSKIANVVPLADAVGTLLAGDRLPPRAVAITFDDGYRDNLDLAVPMLQRLGLPATVFLVPDLLSRKVPAWWESLAWAFTRATVPSFTWEGQRVTTGPANARSSSFALVAERLKRRNQVARQLALQELIDASAPDQPYGSLFLDWDGAIDLVASGVAIGSHSVRHAILSEEEPAEQVRDLASSKSTLEETLGVPVELLAYPNGTTRDYDSATLDAVGQAGYRAAITTRPGRNRPQTPPFELRRFVVYPERGAAGLARATGQTMKTGTKGAVRRLSALRRQLLPGAARRA